MLLLPFFLFFLTSTLPLKHVFILLLALIHINTHFQIFKLLGILFLSIIAYLILLLVLSSPLLNLPILRNFLPIKEYPIDLATLHLISIVCRHLSLLVIVIVIIIFVYFLVLGLRCGCVGFLFFACIDVCFSVETTCAPSSVLEVLFVRGTIEVFFGIAYLEVLLLLPVLDVLNLSLKLLELTSEKILVLLGLTYINRVLLVEHRGSLAEIFFDILS